jgi:hypothetical protein
LRAQLHDRIMALYEGEIAALTESGGVLGVAD